jgi:hypothetical protein
MRKVPGSNPGSEMLGGLNCNTAQGENLNPIPPSIRCTRALGKYPFGLEKPHRENGIIANVQQNGSGVETGRQQRRTDSIPTAAISSAPNYAPAGWARCVSFRRCSPGATPRTLLKALLKAASDS